MKRNTKYKALTAVGAVAALTLSAAPMAHADGLGGISGWAPPTATCGTGNLIPVLMTNATLSPQTFVWQVDGDLAEQVQVNPSDGAICPSRTGSGTYQQNGESYIYSQTVAPGQTFTFNVLLGGVDYSLAANSHTWQVNGDPNSNMWYYPSISLGLTDSFLATDVTYSGTGGVGQSNGQNGFNLVQCSPATLPSSGSSNVGPTATILTPYSENGGSVNYGSGQPMCFAWLPEGNIIISDVTVSGSGYGLRAAELQQLGDAYYAAIGGIVTGGGIVNSVTINGALVPTSPGSATGWFGTVGKSLAVANIPVNSSQDTVVVISTSSGTSTVTIPASIVPATPPVPVVATPSMFTVTSSTTLPETTISAQVISVSGMYATVQIVANNGDYNNTVGGNYETFLLGYAGPNGSATYQQENNVPAIIPSDGTATTMTVTVPIANSPTDAAAGQYLSSATYTTYLGVGQPGDAYSWQLGDAPGWAETGTATFTVNFNG